MNKYLVKIPYSYVQFGELSGFVYANDEEEVSELAQDRLNIHDEEYEDGDGDSTSYSYDDLDIELQEEDVENPPVSAQVSLAAKNHLTKVPSYYLSEVNSVK